MSDTLKHERHIPNREDRRYLPYRDLAIVYEGYNDKIEYRPPDISARGMFINTARHFPEGAVLKLEFRLARSNYEVRARGEVRYCLPGVGIGVEFIEISPESRHAIEKELLTY